MTLCGACSIQAPIMSGGKCGCKVEGACKRKTKSGKAVVTKKSAKGSATKKAPKKTK